MPDRWTRLAPVARGLLRIMAGLLFMQHGLQKFFGFPVAAPWGTVQPLSFFGIGGILELAGGALLALGMFTRPVAFVLSGEMAVAYFMFHAPQSFFPIVSQGDAAVLYCFVFLYLSMAEPDRLTLDRLLTGPRPARPAEAAR